VAPRPKTQAAKCVEGAGSRSSGSTARIQSARCKRCSSCSGWFPSLKGYAGNRQSQLRRSIPRPASRRPEQPDQVRLPLRPHHLSRMRVVLPKDRSPACSPSPAVGALRDPFALPLSSRSCRSRSVLRFSASAPRRSGAGSRPTGFRISGWAAQSGSTQPTCVAGSRLGRSSPVRWRGAPPCMPCTRSNRCARPRAVRARCGD
jgi:hypothetical protein